MKLKVSQTGATSYNFQATKGFQSLIMVATGTNISTMANCEITVKKTNKNGKVHYFYEDAPLEEACLISSMGMGYQLNKHAASDANITTVQRVLHLAKGGDVALLDGEEIDIDITVGSNSDTWNFYGRETGVIATELVEMTTFDIHSASTTTKNLLDYNVIAFDNSKVTEIRGMYTNGQDFEKLIAEIDAEQMFVDDLKLLTDYNGVAHIDHDYSNINLMPTRIGGVRMGDVKFITNASTDIYALKLVGAGKEPERIERTIKANAMIDSSTIPTKSR